MSERRTKRIFVRVSVEEYNLLSAKAEAAGITVSALVRDHFNQVRIFNHSENEQWFRALSAISNTVAALSRAAASLKPIDAVVTIAYLAAIHRQLNGLTQQELRYASEVFPPRNGNE